MSDLLSASSLLMAIAAILFSIWYSEISKALDIKPKKHKEDNASYKKIVTTVLIQKALPVTMMALSIALIFMPDAISLAKESIAAFNETGIAALKNYDSVRTAYCFVTIMSAILAIYTCLLLKKLLSLRRQLS